MPVNFERFKHFPKEAAFLHDKCVVGRKGNANHEDKNGKFTENRNKKNESVSVRNSSDLPRYEGKSRVKRERK